MIELQELSLAGPGATESAVTELAQRARSYRTAAVCVPASLVARAAAELEGAGVHVATVVDEEDPGWAARAAEAATDEGADEVDLVVPADRDRLFALIAACRPETPTLKVVLPADDLVLAADVLDAGADFVVAGAAAARALLGLLRDRAAHHDRGGLKVVHLADAVPALAIVEAAHELLGEDHVDTHVLRLGTTGVLG